MVKKNKIIFIIIILITIIFYKLKIYEPKVEELKYDKQWLDKMTEKFRNLKHYNIYFQKTHKTASTALQNILIRLTEKRKFIPIRFVQNESNTLFITILRKPADQLLSLLNYMFYNEKDFIVKNIRNSSLLNSLCKQSIHYCLIRNSVSHDLGYVKAGYSYKGSKADLINKFNKDYDFVLLKEYFNEGLILLKKILDLSYEDIVCLQVNKGTKNVTVLEKEWAERIVKEVSEADVVLYNHYFEIYKNIAEQLKEEVKELERLNSIYKDKCTVGRGQEFYRSHLLLGYKLRENLTSDLKDICWKLIEKGPQFVVYILELSKSFYQNKTP